MVRQGKNLTVARFVPPRVTYTAVTAALSRVLDLLAERDPGAEALAGSLQHLAQVERLIGPEPVVPEAEWLPAHAESNPRFQPGERGLTPDLTILADEGTSLTGRVCFSPRFAGTAAVHGGAIGLFFDDFLGKVANRNVQGGVARTAYLKVDFRALTPLATDLDCRSWVEHTEGRKRFIRGTISDGGILLAEAEGLWVLPRLSPQPADHDHAE